MGTHNKDVICSIDYETTDVFPAGSERAIERYNITGIEKFAKQMEEKGLNLPKVSLQYELSSSGVIRLVKAEATVEETVVEDNETEAVLVDTKENDTEKVADDAADV